VVTGVAMGTSTITATIGGMNNSTTFTVSAPQPSPPAVTGVPPSSGPGGAPSSTSGPIGPATTSGQGQGNATPAVPVAVNSGGDSATGPVPGSPHHGKARNLTHQARHKAKATHHRSPHESLIHRLAREQLSARMQSLKHPTQR
jgi:hypothetical protein